MCQEFFLLVIEAELEIISTVNCCATWLSKFYWLVVTRKKVGLEWQTWGSVVIWEGVGYKVLTMVLFHLQNFGSCHVELLKFGQFLLLDSSCHSSAFRKVKVNSVPRIWTSFCLYLMPLKHEVPCLFHVMQHNWQSKEQIGLPGPCTAERLNWRCCVGWHEPCSSGPGIPVLGDAVEQAHGLCTSQINNPAVIKQPQSCQQKGFREDLL